MMSLNPFALLGSGVRSARWTLRRALRKPVRILVEIRWRLGDEVMAIPIYEGIKRRYPFCHLTVWCNHPELLRGNPHVDAIVSKDEKPRKLSYDRFILLRGASRKNFRLDEYAKRARIPTPPMNPRLYYDGWRVAALDVNMIAPKTFVVVCTGGTWETKRWPTEHWQELCVRLAVDRQTVLQLGAATDAALDVDVHLLGKTTVREAACVLRAAKLLITGDSGLMHLALAVGTPVMGLFGPTDPAMLVRDATGLTVLTNGRECQGCWNRSEAKFPEGTCPKNISPCMGSLSVSDVLQRARELVRSGA